MANQDHIETTVFCTYHEVDYSFINALEENGLIEISEINQHRYIPVSQLSQLERMIRLHHDLDINVEGIGAIINILQRMESLQQENVSLKNKLRFYVGEQ